MSSIVFENVSKRFILHHEKSRSLQDLVVKTVRRKNGNGSREDFWALRDVSFDVKQGEMVGFIGPNGSGKSTLLKLTAMLIDPTAGHITTNGRINALIELSAGLENELTGRENIYLGGALRGMGRREISKKLDEIVAFSELEKFIDTQVKHYSSGMQLRLGFSIATCIEAEILLVDEVLAVGDAGFKRKSYDRIREIRERGTTVLFVTHQLTEVENSCDRAMLLMEGQIKADGDPSSVLAEYQALTDKTVPAQRSIRKAEYLECQVPVIARLGERIPFSLTLRNVSEETWHGVRGSGVHVVSVGYHWYDAQNQPFQPPSPRTLLTQDLRPGECVTVHGFAMPPRETGAFTLEFDL
ncbi:MAG: ABC transporter ATP-binding protein, partial [Rudaea sp.]